MPAHRLEIAFAAQLEHQVPGLRVRFAWDGEITLWPTVRRQG